jgi:FkbM family methyltransferase
MIVDRLEDTLNGGYGGLYGEVVTEDTYGLRTIKEPIDVIYDIGANVGTFTRFARELFPKAVIVSVEPDPENFYHLVKFTTGEGFLFINEALGIGDMQKHIEAPNGAHESYLPVGMGYTTSDYVPVSTKSAMLDSIVRLCPVPPNGKSIIKIDVEGAENCIWNHRPSMEVLKTMDYIMLELHYCVELGNHAAIKEMCESTVKGIMELTETHWCHYDHIYFYATKK